MTPLLEYAIATGKIFTTDYSKRGFVSFCVRLNELAYQRLGIRAHGRAAKEWGCA